MTLKWSTDLGQSWKNSFLIFPGISAYSSVTTIDNTNTNNYTKNIIVAYERQMGPVSTINLAVITPH